MNPSLAMLLTDARRYLTDKRLYANELDGRRRSETNEQHADRISAAIQDNEDLRELVERIDAALADARSTEN